MKQTYSYIIQLLLRDHGSIVYRQSKHWPLKMFRHPVPILLHNVCIVCGKSSSKTMEAMGLCRRAIISIMKHGRHTLRTMCSRKKIKKLRYRCQQILRIYHIPIKLTHIIAELDPYTQHTSTSSFTHVFPHVNLIWNTKSYNRYNLQIVIYYISMAQCKTMVAASLKHWRYYSIALSHRYLLLNIQEYLFTALQ